MEGHYIPDRAFLQSPKNIFSIGTAIFLPYTIAENACLGKFGVQKGGNPDNLSVCEGPEPSGTRTGTCRIRNIL